MEMKSTYVSGFDEGIVSSLKDFVQVRIWVNDSGSYTHNIFDLTATKLPDDYRKSGSIDYECYKSVYASLPEFIDIHSRSYPYYELPYHGFLNAFNRLFYYCYDLLVSNKIEQVIFSNLPHEGFDFLICKIAQYLRLPMLMFIQTQFPNKFWALREVCDFGRFSQLPNLSSYESYKLKTSFDWFYMSEKQYSYGWKRVLSDLKKKPLSFPYVFYKYKQSHDFRRSLSECLEKKSTWDASMCISPCICSRN